MLFLARFIRPAIIALGLASLAVVLAPGHTQPLWDWARSIAGLFGHDTLPPFDVTQHWAALALTTFVSGGLAYNLWRDRRHNILRAEYDYRTGATHLKEKVAELQAQMRRVTAERDQWEDSYLKLNKKHTEALIAAREHEVRSEFGRCDREALAALRKTFDEVMQAKGHTEGFREAMSFFLAHLSEPVQRAESVALEVTSNGSSGGQDKDQRRALPFALPPRS